MKISIILSIALASQISSFASASSFQSRYQPFMGTRGMVVSDDREASSWGAEILRQGGNAIDAAVATAFALAVTRPHYAALGGGGFLIFCPKPTEKGGSPCQAIDYREQAPKAAHRDLYIRNGKGDTHLSQNGALASGIPGVPAGLLLALEKYGTLSRQKILRRPIELAKKGYEFTSYAENAAHERWPFMNEAAKQIFGCSPNQKIPKTPCATGTVIRQPDLAQVLMTISKQGTQGFYEGPVAKKITHEIKSAGGILTLEDLRSYRPKLRDVIQGKFKGHEVISMPPPSSGGAILIQLLGYVQRADQAEIFKDGFESANSIHAIAHAMSLAFADRAQYFGDPDFVQVPLTSLISPQYLDQQWKTFQLNKASLPAHAGTLPKPEPQHTTHFSVIDRFGNAVSVTTTVNDDFGSGFVPSGTGIVMNNQMDDFSIEPGVPNLFGLVGAESNAVAASKRPLSSMSPTIIRDNKGNTQIVIGAAGGPRIITSVFLSLLNRLRFGMSLTDAVAAPRFHQQWKPTSLRMERFGFSSETKSALLKKGYQLEEVDSLGKVHALERLPNGRTIGVADFRGEGAAIAE
jgi:gamma-glutamyltranspeptidase/glutathione hydrolase